MPERVFVTPRSRLCTDFFLRLLGLLHKKGREQGVVPFTPLNDLPHPAFQHSLILEPAEVCKDHGSLL